MRELTETLLAAQEAPVQELKNKITFSDPLGVEDDIVIEEDRILQIPSQEEASDSQAAVIVLQNADGYFTDLDLKGWQAVLEWGLVTEAVAGVEYSAIAPLKVISQYEPSAPGVLQCRLSLIGIPNLLAEDKASKDYFHHWSDLKKVKAMITEIADGNPVSTELTEEQTKADSYIDLKDGIHGAGQRLTITERTVTKLAFRIKKTGTPTGTNVTLRIRDADTEDILASKTFPIASISTSPAWCEVTFDSPVAVDQDVWIYCEHTDGTTSNYISVYYNSYAIKPEEWFMQVNAAGDPVTEWADRDCAYRYKYTGDGIDCFDHCQAYEVVYDSEDSLIDSYQPKDAFRIYEGQSRLDKINQLLGYTGCEKRVRADGKIHVFVPVTSDVKYEYYITGDDNKRAISNLIWGAQSFTPTVSHKITSIKLKMARWEFPGTITVSIRATDESGHPAGEDLCSGTTNGNTLPDQTTGEWREITLGAGCDLEADTKYAIVMRAEAAEVWWRHDGTGTYTGGSQMGSLNQGVDWSDYPTCDFMFEDWGGTYDSEYSLESGHTFFSKAVRKALVIPNRIVVKSLKEAENQYTGEATDAESYALLSITGSPIRTSLVSSAQGTSIAQAMISRLQVAAQRGAASVPNNLGAEFCDYVKVTDSRQGNYRVGNIGYIRRSWKRGEVPRMDFSLGRVPIKRVPGTRPSLLPEAQLMPEPTLEEQILRWGMIKPSLEIIEINFEEVWKSFDGIIQILNEILSGLGWFEGESPTDTQILLALLNYYTKAQVDGKLNVISHDEPTRAIGVVYQNTSGKIRLVTVSVRCELDASDGDLRGSSRILAYTDSSNPPTTIVGQAGFHTWGIAGLTAATNEVKGVFAVTFPVAPGEYYKVDESVSLDGVSPVLSDWHEWDLH